MFGDWIPVNNENADWLECMHVCKLWECSVTGSLWIMRMLTDKYACMYVNYENVRWLYPCEYWECGLFEATWTMWIFAYWYSIREFGYLIMRPFVFINSIIAETVSWLAGWLGGEVGAGGRVQHDPGPGKGLVHWIFTLYLAGNLWNNKNLLVGARSGADRRLNRIKIIRLRSTDFNNLFLCLQVSNWFANARRRLKNVVQESRCSWSKRLRLYNRFVQVSILYSNWTVYQ
jgi:hypothetical protein